MDDGREVIMQAGEFFFLPPRHDSWLLGDDPYVSLHFMVSVDALVVVGFIRNTSSIHLMGPAATNDPLGRLSGRSRSGT